MRLILGCAVAALLTGCATTTASPNLAWVARHTADPITGITRCTVTAPDRTRFGSFTRTAMLYPFVEVQSEAGLLVGVSSGGSIRLPPGDIQWRVDQNAFRTIHQSDTPVFGDAQTYMDTSSLTPEARASIETAMAANAGLMSSIQNGVTAVDGERAVEMLSEMKSGSGLLFRSATAAPAAGVPSAATYQVGQYSSGQLEPIPLDASFHAALTECGLDSQ